MRECDDGGRLMLMVGVRHRAIMRTQALGLSRWTVVADASMLDGVPIGRHS